MSDNWSSGDAYEAYVGRWSRLVAREFLGWLEGPAGARWLDVGCGTGELCRAILAGESPESVTGVDPSEGFLEYARGQADGVEYRVGDAQSLPFGDGAFDAVVSGLVLNFVPDPGKGAAEMLRVTRAEGVLGAYVWDYAEGMQFLRYFWEAAEELDAGAGKLNERDRFGICDRVRLGELFTDAGAADVETRGIEVPTVFESFDDLWSPFLGGTGPAPVYVASLGDAARERLRESLRERLPVEEDGSIRLTARAWAVRGRRG